MEPKKLIQFRNIVKEFDGQINPYCKTATIPDSTAKAEIHSTMEQETQCSICSSHSTSQNSLASFFIE